MISEIATDSIAFIIGCVASWSELATEYLYTREFALKNFWARGFILLNGLISLVVFLVVSPIDSLQFAVRPVNNPYLGALIIGISWQAVLRSKAFVIRTSAGKEISLGIEPFWNQLAEIFKTRIAEYEEVILSHLSNLIFSDIPI